MISAPILIALPNGCSTPLVVFTGAPADGLGGGMWSDGKCDAAVSQEVPSLRKHPVENVLFWDGEWKVIETIPPQVGGVPNEWRDLPVAAVPDDRDLLQAIATGMGGSGERLRHLRTRLWWAGNDPLRSAGFGTLPPVQVDNLLKLARLLDPAIPEQRLWRAEAFRELGFFDEAIRLLEDESEWSDWQRKVAGFLKRHCALQNSQVVRLPVW